MKSLARSVVICSVVFLATCLSAQGQDCSPWASVTSWTGTYSITGTGGGPDVLGIFTWTIDHSASGPLSMTGGGGCTGSLQWKGLDAGDSSSVADVGTGTPCPTGPTLYVADGNGVATGGGTLIVDTTAGTYTFSVEANSPGSSQATVCGIVEPPGGSPQVWPLVNAPACNELYTQPFALPSSVGPLTESDIVFSTGAECPYLPATVWTLTFTLTPNLAPNDNQDDPCAVLFASSIACQNQSLGEDVPITGTTFSLHYESERLPGTSGANRVASADALSLGGWTLNVHHAYDPGTNTLFLGNGTQRSTWQFGTPVTLNGNTLLTSQDGSEIYVFSSAGQHLQTLKPLTGALKYQFAYDTTGNLSTITDASGNVTTIERDGSEHPTGIVSPFAQTTSLSLDANGFLSQATDPAGNTIKLTNSSGGLMTSRTDANGNLYGYTYDSSGKLTRDSDPVGGSTSLSRIDSSTGYSVTKTTSLGKTSTYQVTTGVTGEQFTNTWPNGLRATFSDLQQNGQFSTTTSLPDGTATNETMGPDPRWGLQAPVATSGHITLGNLTMTEAGTRKTVLGTTGNPFSVTRQTDTETVNGRKYTSVFTASTKTLVDTTPMKRKTTRLLDSLERVSSTQVGTLLSMHFAYDNQGRLTTITQGTRTTTLAYDSHGFLASASDPLNLTTSFARDGDGRLLTLTLPDGRAINYTYDPNGNVTSVTPPGKSAHDMAYTAVDLISAYIPPTVSGTGETTFAYDADRNPTTITRPDGQTIQFSYDNAGRLSSTTTPTEDMSYSYDVTSGKLIGASISGGEGLSYDYNGRLLASSALTGNVAGTVSRTYNNNFWLASESINGGDTVNYTYDNDGLVTNAGTLAVQSNGDSLTSGTTLGSATDVRAYDTFGELSNYTAKYGASVLYTDKFTRDADGRVSTKTETIAGKKTTYAYSYDSAGRLIGVKKNGVSASSYTYDTNSNRLTATTSAGTVTGTYDAQDRMLAYGSGSYIYTANGELASQTLGSQKTTYSYDVLGNLIAAALPKGSIVSYIVDAENHRVGKVVNGTLTIGFLYDDGRIVAQVNASNSIVSQFVYGTSSTTPDYMVSGGVTYRIFFDQLGSPRLVVNTSTGATVEEMDYDEFGNVINDTNPGFQPFGFAGGLYDQDTKFVRFGVRDYDPSIGRWTAKDPILFAGGDSNLYGYILNDPVNRIDPRGEVDFGLVGPFSGPNPFLSMLTPGPPSLNSLTELVETQSMYIDAPAIHEGNDYLSAEERAEFGEFLNYVDEHPGVTFEIAKLNLSAEEAKRGYERAEAVGAVFGGEKSKAAELWDDFCDGEGE